MKGLLLCLLAVVLPGAALAQTNPAAQAARQWRQQHDAPDTWLGSTEGAPKKLVELVLVAILVAASRTAGGPEQGSGAGTGEVLLLELQQTLAKAWVSADRATIERIIAPDWRSTGPDGRMTDRAGVLADVFETRRHKIHRVEIDDVNARVFGDAAVVTGRTHGVGEVEGSTYDVVIRFTDTFVRREGRWQAVASHASLVDR